MLRRRNDHLEAILAEIERVGGRVDEIDDKRRHVMVYWSCAGRKLIQVAPKIKPLGQRSTKRSQRDPPTRERAAPMPDLSLQYDAIQLYDLNFGPRLVPVTPPDCDISPSSKIHPKDRGKAPGKLTPSGWVGVDVNNPKFRCLDYGVAKLWRDEWGANVGFVVGDGFIVVDNDQGESFSRIFRALVLQYTLVEPLRRYVLDPRHERDAFFVRIVDFVGDGAPVANKSFKFRNGVLATEVQLLASGKQAVIAGLHPGTRSPYVWSRALEGLDQIPVMSVDKFDEFITNIFVEAQKLGWALDGAPPPSVSATVSAPAATFV